MPDGRLPERGEHRQPARRHSRFSSCFGFGFRFGQDDGPATIAAVRRGIVDP